MLYSPRNAFLTIECSILEINAFLTIGQVINLPSQHCLPQNYFANLLDQKTFLKYFHLNILYSQI